MFSKPQQAQQILTQLENATRPGNSRKAIDVGETVKAFRQLVSLNRTEFARQLQVAPQTVGRWEANQTKPRRNQILKFESLLPTEDVASETKPNLERENTGRLGIHLSDTIFELEKHAKEVWIVKSGRLREADRGFIGESIFEALQNGVHFRYVFLAGTTADKSFRRELKPWVKSERVSGTVTGYCIKSHALAFDLGLSSSPCAWIVVKYNAEQRLRLKRHFDVFLALSAREYSDVEHSSAKNEDGQPCWVELATPRASAFASRLATLISPDKNSTDVEILRIDSARR